MSKVSRALNSLPKVDENGASFLSVPDALNVLIEAAQNLDDETNTLKQGGNIIIGGDFSTNLWQRGESFTSVVSNTYTADRWEYFKKGTGFTHDILKTKDSPIISESDTLATDCLHIKLTASKSSLTPVDVVGVVQYIEGYNTRSIVPSFVLSFWVKATKTGTYCVAFRNSNADRSYVAEYTINQSNTWEKKTITVTGLCDTGTWDYENGIGLQVCFVLACGTNHQCSKDTWNTGSYFATSSQVNGVESTMDCLDFKLNLVQIEEGTEATQFNSRKISDEMSLCQRYYMRLGAGNRLIYYGFYARTGSDSYFTLFLPMEMRVVPSILKIGTWYVSNCSQPEVAYMSRSSVVLCSKGLNNNQAYFGTVDLSTYLELNAELSFKI